MRNPFALKKPLLAFHDVRLHIVDAQTRNAEMIISRFRVRCGACHRAAPCTDLLASPRDPRDVAFDAGVVAEHVDCCADIFRDFVLIGDVGGDGQRLRRQIPDRGFHVLLFAVDRDNTRAVLGQQPHGRGADDAARAGDDDDLAVQTSSIWHVVRFPLAHPVVPDFWRFGALCAERADYFICGVG
jgi:hypothetical protein